MCNTVFLIAGRILEFPFDMSQIQVIGSKLLDSFGSSITITEGAEGSSAGGSDTITSHSSGNSGGSDGISNWKRPQYSQVKDQVPSDVFKEIKTVNYFQNYPIVKFKRNI